MHPHITANYTLRLDALAAIVPVDKVSNDDPLLPALLLNYLHLLQHNTSYNQLSGDTHDISTQRDIVTRMHQINAAACDNAVINADLDAAESLAIVIKYALALVEPRFLVFEALEPNVEHFHDVIYNALVAGEFSHLNTSDAMALIRLTLKLMSPPNNCIQLWTIVRSYWDLIPIHAVFQRLPDSVMLHLCHRLDYEGGHQLHTLLELYLTPSNEENLISELINLLSHWHGLVLEETSFLDSVVCHLKKYWFAYKTDVIRGMIPWLQTFIYRYPEFVFAILDSEMNADFLIEFVVGIMNKVTQPNLADRLVTILHENLVVESNSHLWKSFSNIRLQLCPATIDKHQLLIVDYLQNNQIVDVLLLALPSQLFTFPFSNSFYQTLMRLVCDKIVTLEWRHHEPLAYTVLGSLLSLPQILSSKQDQNRFLSAIIHGLQQSAQITLKSIHMLHILSFNYPLALSKYLPPLLLKLASIMTSGTVGLHILEYLIFLSYFPDLFVNFREDDYKCILAIAVKFIQTNRPATDKNQNVYHDYILTMAYRVITRWMHVVKYTDRDKFSTYIERNLSSLLQKGSEQTIACLDTIRSGEHVDTDYDMDTQLEEAEIFVMNRAIVTLQNLKNMNAKFMVVSIRRASRVIKWRVPKMSSDQFWLWVIEGQCKREPSYELLQAGFTDSPEVIRSSLYTVPKEMPKKCPSELVSRALSVLDHTPITDLHKIGVVYIGPNQANEYEILANTHGSLSYTSFIRSLGAYTRLQDASIYTGGLDTTDNLDGDFACYVTDVSYQIIFHIATLMPTLEHDDKFINKKRHLGNNFVTVIVNESGHDYDPRTLDSQFNLFQIIVTPIQQAQYGAEQLFPAPMDKKSWIYGVKLIHQDTIPETIPSEVKYFSNVQNAAEYVRHIAVHADMFAQIYQKAKNSGEHVSCIQERMRQLIRLHERVSNHFKSDR